MSIKGLTTDREPAFPRIGTLRKGGEKPNEKQPGKDLTYFRFDSDDKQAVQDFEAAYGKEPATINVYLPFPTPDENFQAWQEEYKAGGLVHRCDGETMTVWQTADGKYSNEPKPCPHVGKARTSVNPYCKPVGRLTVIIPELRRFAYVTVGTTSKNDIMELTDNLNAVYAMRGTLQGIPFRLMRRPRMISTPKADGGRARYEKWMLSIEADPAWVSVQIASMQRASLIAPDMKMLTAGRTVQVDTGEIFEDEEDAAQQATDAYNERQPFEPEGSRFSASLADVEPRDFDDPPTASEEFNAIPSVPTGQPSSAHTATQSKQAAQAQSTQPVAPPTNGQPASRNKMHAILGQMDGGIADKDGFRYFLVGKWSNGEHATTTELDDENVATFVEWLEQLKKNRLTDYKLSELRAAFQPA